MKETYKAYIKKNYNFPFGDFDVNNNELKYQGIDLMALISKYSTPLKMYYLPKIGDQINKAKTLFNEVKASHDYQGSYYYCYCTKCNYFNDVITSALKSGAHLETSSPFDIDLILKLDKEKQLQKDIFILHNGYKTNNHLSRILDLVQNGFDNSIIILDSIQEYSRLENLVKERKLLNPIKLGLRISVDGIDGNGGARLGINESHLTKVFLDQIVENDSFSLEMLHFFVDDGIKDSDYYWSELDRVLSIYINLKSKISTLKSFNIGGGFPVRNDLDWHYDYKYYWDKIIGKIVRKCNKENIVHPDLFTEFGKYTVGESAITIFEVVENKIQSEGKNWYMIDNSLVNTIPDIWAINEKFLFLPINNWDKQALKTKIGVITCDQSDVYPKGKDKTIVLPQFSNKNVLYLGVFNTGAYQEALSGYGGVNHCLIPSPKIVFVDKDKNGKMTDWCFKNEQKSNEILNILGFN